MSEGLFFCSSPNFGWIVGPNLSEGLFLIYLFVLQLILGARHRSSYPWKNFSEALVVNIIINYSTCVCTGTPKNAKNNLENNILFCHIFVIDVISIGGPLGPTPLGYAYGAKMSDSKLASFCIRLCVPYKSPIYT